MLKKIQRLLKVAIEVIHGNQRFQGGDDRTIKIAVLGWTEHGRGLGESQVLRRSFELKCVQARRSSTTGISRLCELCPAGTLPVRESLVCEMGRPRNWFPMIAA